MNNILEENLKSLYERGDLSFGKLKEKLLKSSKLFKIKKYPKVPVDPKSGKHILLSFSVKEGKLRFAKNISETKKGGFDIKEACGNYGDLKEHAMSSFSLFEKQIHNLSLEEQQKIFGENADKFYKVKIFHTPKERKNYDCKRMLVEKDGCVTNGPSVMENINEQTALFEKLLNEWHDSIREELYSEASKSVKRINECANGIYGNNAVSKINSHVSSVNSLLGKNNFSLDDNSSMDDYMLARVYILLNGMLDRPKSQPVDAITKSNIAKRLLGVKGISVSDIIKSVPKEQQEYVRENILNNNSRKEILNNAISPVENIIFDFINGNLDGIKSILVLQDTPDSKRLAKTIDINKPLMAAGNNISSHRNVLRGLRNLDRHLKSNNTFSFDYDGMTYEPSYDSLPINNMLNMLKFVEEASNASVEANVLEEKDIYNLVKEMSMSSGAISIGSVPVALSRRKKNKWKKQKS